jgi:hypothetical protein
MPVMNAGGEAVTTNLSGARAAAADVTVAATPEPPMSVSLQDAVNSATAGPAPMVSGDDQKTVSFYKKSMGSEPVVGWLICIEGAHFGEDFRLKSGRNFIGRGADMDVVISKDSTVSRDRHVAVVYEPKGRAFLVMPGESKELSYLGGDVVLMPAALKPYDKLTVGETKLMFVPCCGQHFGWDDVMKKEEN